MRYATGNRKIGTFWRRNAQTSSPPSLQRFRQMPSRKLLDLLATLGVLIALSGCGGSSATNTTGTGTSAPVVTAAQAPTQAPATSTLPAPTSSGLNHDHRPSKARAKRPRPKPQPAAPPKARPGPYATDPQAHRIYTDKISECRYLRYGSRFSASRAIAAVRQETIPARRDVAQAGCEAAYK